MTSAALSSLRIGDLEAQPHGSTLASAANSATSRGEVRALELQRRDIDSDGHDRHICIDPAAKSSQHMLERLLTELDNQTALLGNRDELTGWNQAEFRVSPPHQRFKRGDRPVRISITGWYSI